MSNEELRRQFANQARPPIDKIGESAPPAKPAQNAIYDFLLHFGLLLFLIIAPIVNAILQIIFWHYDVVQSVTKRVSRAKP